MLIAAIAFLIAGLVKGVIGLGLPTVAIGLLGLVMPPAEAAALLVVPSLVTNIWQLAAGPSFMTLLLRLWPMLMGICIGTWGATAAGAALLAGGEADHAAGALGVALRAGRGAAGLRVLRAFQSAVQGSPPRGN